MQKESLVFFSFPSESNLFKVEFPRVKIYMKGHFGLRFRVYFSAKPKILIEMKRVGEAMPVPPTTKGSLHLIGCL